jgi:hypothetical protein
MIFESLRSPVDRLCSIPMPPSDRRAPLRAHPTIAALPSCLEVTCASSNLGPIQNALPRADTGHNDSTLPFRTPTYQS